MTSQSKNVFEICILYTSVKDDLVSLASSNDDVADVSSLCDTYDEQVSSYETDDENISDFDIETTPLDNTRCTLPTTLQLQAQPTKYLEYIHSYNWEPKRGPAPKRTFEGSFGCLSEYVTILTEEQ